MEEDWEKKTSRGITNMPPLTSSDESDDGNDEIATRMVRSVDKKHGEPPPPQEKKETSFEALKSAVDQREGIKSTINYRKKNEGCIRREQIIRRRIRKQEGFEKHQELNSMVINQDIVEGQRGIRPAASIQQATSVLTAKKLCVLEGVMVETQELKEHVD